MVQRLPWFRYCWGDTSWYFDNLLENALSALYKPARAVMSSTGAGAESTEQDSAIRDNKGLLTWRNLKHASVEAWKKPTNLLTCFFLQPTGFSSELRWKNFQRLSSWRLKQSTKKIFSWRNYARNSYTVLRTQGKWFWVWGQIVLTCRTS